MTTQRNKIFQLTDNLEKPFLFIGLLMMILIITYQTGFRYFLSTTMSLLASEDIMDLLKYFGFSNIQATFISWNEHVSKLSGLAVWTEETSRYIFIWTTYLAIPLAIKQRSNIRVDIVYSRLSEKAQGVSWIIVDLCMLTLCSVIFYNGVEHIQMQFTFPQTTAALRIPYYIPYLILPVGFGLMTIRLFEDLYYQVTRTSIKGSIIGIVGTIILFLPVMLWEDANAIALLFGYFVVLLFIGVPIAFSLGIAALMTVIGAETLPMSYIAGVAFTAIDNFPIMAIPFFIAAGIFMSAGGLSQRLLNLADELLGGLAGGMALASIATCMFFASISGSGPATVAAIGAITIPAMVTRGYDKMFAAAVVASAGAIGVMIPPSNPFVVYGVTAQASIGKLFIAGIIPGVFTGLVLMFITYLIARKKGWRGDVKDRNIVTITKASWNAKWALLVPVIVLGGIYGGIMTPTEAAAIAAIYGLFVGIFVYKELTLKTLWSSTIESANMSSVIIMLMAMATIFGNIMTLEQIPEQVAKMILDLTQNPIIILLLINLLLLWVGTFMEALAAIVILTPILLPLAIKLGLDPIHFGVIMVVNLAIGFITPPVGVNLFVASGIAKAKIGDIAKAGFPFLLAMIGVLLLITYIPAISLILL